MGDQLLQQKVAPPIVWTQSVQPLVWSAPIITAPLVTYVSSWKSPLFDLRPDLRSSTAVTKVGIPIWTRSGRLYAQFFGLEGNNNERLKMFATEFANVNLGESSQSDPTLIVPAISVPIDVSVVMSFAAQTAPGSAVLGYAPYSASLGGGEGYPIRFWYLQLNFVKIFEVGFSVPPPPVPTPPPVRIQAGFY